MNNLSTKWKEECGVFGVYSKVEDVSLMCYFGLYALQHRGQESAGIAITNGTNMDVKKGMGLVGEVFREHLPAMENKFISIGHVRYSTTGSSLLCNTQPLIANYAGGKIALAHNGNLTNAKNLRRNMEKDGTIFQTTMDTEVILNMIAKSQRDTIEEKIIETAKKIEGAFCLCIMTEDKLIALRDKHGFRPLCYGKTKEGSFVISSESCGLDVVGADFIDDVMPGEMVVIDKKGLQAIRYAEANCNVCSFEYIYFARPDSILDGQSVQQARFNMGRILAKESKYTGDIVISVPDSGNTAAMGFAYESKIPYIEGLIKNRYIGRTFIQPTQEKREMAVRLKLNPIANNIKGKDIILVDDSIVRGTTSKRIISMLYKKGAKSIKMVLSAPPIKYPCYYGVDTSVRKELIASAKSIEEIKEYIGVDNLYFISEKGLRDAFDSIDPNKICYACFNNDYPVLKNDIGEDEKFVFE